MITENYVSFEVAKLLKEKGFDWDCKTRKFFPEPDYDEESPDGVYTPTLQMAMKWLREVHRIETHIVLSELNSDNSRKYMFDIYSSDINRDFDSIQMYGFDSYEQAVEAAIKYTLKNLI